MKVVSTGNTYKIYDETLKTYDQLPAQVYQVNFEKMSGFFLSKMEDIVIKEKIYGVHEEKVSKVLSSFSAFSRNLGVILSGDKGIGKSMFAKLLSVKAIDKGYPLIIVNHYIPGIADYLESIQQEVVVLFDEFDKTFNSKDSRDSMNDPQAEMLTLFDGLSQGKKLFVVTCNNLNSLNDYLVNRPGRFHYHFRFDYPDGKQIREYLMDKIDEKFYGEIDNVITFANKVPINYDCLRAIAFELSLGSSFSDAVKDLNIVNVTKELYKCTLVFESGIVASRETYLDMFGDSDTTMEFRYKAEYDFDVKFNPSDAVFDVTTGENIVKSEDITIDWQDYYYDGENQKEALAQRKMEKVAYMSIRRNVAKSIHYTV